MPAVQSPGASTTNVGANYIQQRDDINNAADQQMGRATATFEQETAPQLNSMIGVAGNWYDSSKKKAQNVALRHYEDDQEGILQGANRALNQVAYQQAYAATGAIIG